MELGEVVALGEDGDAAAVRQQRPCGRTRPLPKVVYTICEGFVRAAYLCYRGEGTFAIQTFLHFDSSIICTERDFSGF